MQCAPVFYKQGALLLPKYSVLRGPLSLVSVEPLLHAPSYPHHIIIHLCGWIDSDGMLTLGHLSRDNHTACSDGYNLSCFPRLECLNSSVAEQYNSALNRIRYLRLLYLWLSRLACTLSVMFVICYIVTSGGICADLFLSEHKQPT
jgi:hypothetical protein